MSQLPAFISGSSDWRKLSEDVRRMERAVFGGGMTGLNVPSGRTVVQGRGEEAGARLYLHEFKVVNGTDHPDTIICDDPASGDTGIHVAKPYLLRRTPFHQKRRDGIEFDYTSNTERKATRKEPPPPQGQAEPTENQRVIAKWVAGDRIYAVAGLFGELGGIKRTVGDTEDMVVRWLDFNLDGRYWAKV